MSRTDSHEPFDSVRKRGPVHWATFRGFSKCKYQKFVERTERRRVRHTAKAQLRAGKYDDQPLEVYVRNGPWMVE